MSDGNDPDVRQDDLVDIYTQLRLLDYHQQQHESTVS